MGPRTLSRWVVPAGLVALSLVPAVAGSLRLVELGTSGEVTPANARFFEHPIATSLHIVSSLLFALLGAFQIPDTIRHAFPRWHRGAGRILLPAGFAMALSGLWLTGVMPAVAYDGPALFAMRLVVGGAILASLALGVRSLVVRDFAAHGVWMLRAYALGLGAGTQVFTHVPWFVFPEIRGETTRAVLMGAGWAVNLVVCEAVLRRRRAFRGTPADLHGLPGTRAT